MTEQNSVPALGGSSLLVIFGVLCLTVFSLLTLSTAQAEKRLSDSAASACSAYYEADSQAEEIFALLRVGQIPSQVRQTGNLFSYSIPITEYQSLQVQLRKEEDWQVLAWQTVVSSYPAIDETLHLWSGSNQEVSP